MRHGQMGHLPKEASTYICWCGLRKFNSNVLKIFVPNLVLSLQIRCLIRSLNTVQRTENLSWQRLTTSNFSRISPTRTGSPVMVTSVRCFWHAYQWARRATSRWTGSNSSFPKYPATSRCSRKITSFWRQWSAGKTSVRRVTASAPQIAGRYAAADRIISAPIAGQASPRASTTTPMVTIGTCACL